jgi:hypothetical protein
MDASLHIFLISASDAGCWTTFPAEGAPVALERRLCRPHSRPGHGAEQICALVKSKPVAYWAIPPPIHHFYTHIIFITLMSQTNWMSRTAPGWHPLAATDWDGQSNKKRRNAGVSMGNNGKHVLQIRTVTASWSLRAATPWHSVMVHHPNRRNCDTTTARFQPSFAPSLRTVVDSREHIWPG